MHLSRLPGLPTASLAPRKLMPMRIAPAKQAARLLVERSQAKLKEEATHQQLHAGSVIQPAAPASGQGTEEEVSKALDSGPGTGRAGSHEAWTRQTKKEKVDETDESVGVGDNVAPVSTTRGAGPRWRQGPNVTQEAGEWQRRLQR